MEYAEQTFQVRILYDKAAFDERSRLAGDPGPPYHGDSQVHREFVELLIASHKGLPIFEIYLNGGVIFNALPPSSIEQK
jgi:hypothetical protein